MSEDREKAEKWASRIKYSNYFPLEDCDLAEAHLAGQESRQEEIDALREAVLWLNDNALSFPRIPDHVLARVIQSRRVLGQSRRVLGMKP